MSELVALPKPSSNALADTLRMYESVIDSTFRFKNPLSVILSGPPGLGKSTMLRGLCKKYGHKWEPIRPSAKGLVELMWEFEKRHRTAPVIVDDYDDLFDSKALLQLLKVILDSHGERRLSNDVRGRMKISPFRVTLAVVFLTNRDITNRKHFSKSVWETDIPALRDRTTVMALPFDPRVVLEYTLNLAPTVLAACKQRDPATGYDAFLNRAQRDEIIEHLALNSHRYRQVSPRLIDRLGKLRLSMPDDATWNAFRETQLG
jgi:hypothetical protein